MAQSNIVKYVTQEEYMNFAVNSKKYEERFNLHNETFADKHDTIEEYILALVLHYNRKYGLDINGKKIRTMRFALVEWIHDGETVTIMSYGFPETSKELKGQFYCCC